MMVFFTCDSGSDGFYESVYSDSWVFIANEGNYGATNGTISMIAENGEIYETNILGDVVQSLEVYGDKLIALINNSNKIKIYDITTEGLSMPGIEIDCDSPREMVVVDNRVYITSWSGEIKIFNLFNYTFENPISVSGLPEGIIEKDGKLWVAVTMELDWTPGSYVYSFDIETGASEGAYYVDAGPVSLEFVNEILYVSRTYYDTDFSPNHGMSMVDGLDVISVDYGAGVACGGSIVSINNQVYRTLPADQPDGGIVALDESLGFNANIKIGSYQQSYIYHVEVVDDYLWFAVTNSDDYNYVKKLTLNGVELASYKTGIAPGDFAFWSNND